MLIVIDCKLKDTRMKSQGNTLVEEDFKDEYEDEEEELVEDMAILSVTTMDRLDTSREIARTL